jgi:hypothetical protein
MKVELWLNNIDMFLLSSQGLRDEHLKGNIKKKVESIKTCDMFFNSTCRERGACKAQND